VITVRQKDILLKLSPNDGRVLFSRETDGVLVEVHELDNLRWLYFGGDAFQSVMDLERPEIPVLPYTVAMLGALLFQHEPASVLNLGMGGGSFERFFTANYPNASVVSVEASETVIGLSQYFFHVPDGGTVVQSSIDEYMRGCSAVFDLIFCDASDFHGHPPCLSDTRFYSEVFGALKAGGVFVLNLLPNSESQMVEYLLAIRQSFAYVSLVDIADYRNIVVFCMDESPCNGAVQAEQAELLLKNYGLDLSDALLGFRLLPLKR
jgi:spermidine synthase